MPHALKLSVRTPKQLGLLLKPAGIEFENPTTDNCDIS